MLGFTKRGLKLDAKREKKKTPNQIKFVEISSDTGCLYLPKSLINQWSTRLRNRSKDTHVPSSAKYLNHLRRHVRAFRSIQR